MVHFSSSNGDSSEDDKDDKERVSFEDMLEQARAQSDIYSAEEDSDDEDFEPYTFQYEDIYKDRVATEGVDAILTPVASNTREAGAQLSVAVPATELCAFSTSNCSTRQESSVSSPCGDTDMVMH